MKANSIKSVLFSLVVVLNCTFASAQEEKNFIYDTKYDNNEMMISKTVYENIDNYLAPKIQYQYKHDDMGRVIEKVAYKWDSEEREWVLSHRISCSYNDDQTVEIRYGKWNPKDKDFNKDIQNQIYSTDEASKLISAR